MLKSTYSGVRKRWFSLELPHHISVVLYSNSGVMPLKNKSYHLQIDEERTLSGNTDDEGYLFCENVSSGYFNLILDNGFYEIPIPSMPIDIERYPIRLPGYFLMDQSDFEGFNLGALGELDENNLLYRSCVRRAGHSSSSVIFSDLQDPRTFDSDSDPEC